MRNYINIHNFLQEFQDTKVPTQSVNPLPATAQNMATVAYTQRYVELIRLVNKQRDTISAQQTDISKVRYSKTY